MRIIINHVTKVRFKGPSCTLGICRQHDLYMTGSNRRLVPSRRQPTRRLGETRSGRLIATSNEEFTNGEWLPCGAFDTDHLRVSVSIVFIHVGR